MVIITVDAYVFICIQESSRIRLWKFQIGNLAIELMKKAQQHSFVLVFSCRAGSNQEEKKIIQFGQSYI